MREILFRGKRIDNGEWAYGYLVVLRGDAFIFCDVTVNDPMVAKVDPATVGQFTDQIDINGKKIFDGDIVDILCENEETGTIKWDIDTARFVVSADGFVADFDNYYGKDLEVISNIHDQSSDEVD